MTEATEDVRAAALFEVLHRLARLQEDCALSPAYTPMPLNPDIADCVAQGWVMAYESTDEARLVLRPEGRLVYDALCKVLAQQGHPVLGWKPADQQ